MDHIEVDGLSVEYNGHQVLKDISLKAPDKEITVVLGPSGCGKTTLLKCFNRLIDNVEGAKVSGRVLVDGEDIFAPGVELTHIRKKMGLLSQRPCPLPMNIYDNVAFGPRVHGVKARPELNRIVERNLRIAHLWDEVKDRLSEPASKLSVGQQQRLCLARGLAVEPEIILADEPTSSLDPVSCTHIERGLSELKKDYTIILVTHILRQAKRVADHVVFMYMGEIVEQGPARELFENPRERLTKDYLAGSIS